jgi:CarboxypepD_reg-like domain
VLGYGQKQRGGVASYFFRGRVTDEKNKPLPYASIRISNSNMGTYADVNGNFSIVAADSILKTEIKSVGFSNKKTDLFAATGLAIIRLEASSSQLNEVVVNSRKAKQPEQQANKNSKDDPGVTKYAEPACGWALYELYLTNNLRIPLTQGGATLKGSVTISFFVDPVNGRLYDFNIENSMGILYDKEAIRVLKDGPLWDVFNSEKGIRTSFTVIF